jgi:hypothetical protein
MKCGNAVSYLIDTYWIISDSLHTAREISKICHAFCKHHFFGMQMGVNIQPKSIPLGSP